MISACRLEERGEDQYWCLDCNRPHNGHVATLSQEMTEKGDSYRRLWRGMPQIEKEPPRILRSLPLAKTCTYFGERLTQEEVKEKQLVGCRTCTNEVPAFHCNLPGAKKFNEGPYTRIADCLSCRDWQAKPHIENPVVGTEISRQAIRFDHHNLFPGTPGIRFNSSIIEANYGYIFAFRNGWSGSNLFICRMDKNFQPYGECKKLELGKKGAAVGREDPRLFRLNGKLHISYTGYGGRITNVLYARINEEFLEVEDVFFPQIPGRQKWEKNHTYFDYQGIAHAVYDTTPNHRILRVEGTKAEFAYSTPFKGSWSGGFMRGGASPVLHNGEMWHWFHGAVSYAGRRRYNIGVTVFRADPPFDILRYTPSPIDEADISNDSGNYCWCVFPGGAVYKDGQWAVAMGINDRYSEIRFYGAESVENSLVSV